MNAPLSYKERHAIDIHRQINADAVADPFDQDYCPTEVRPAVVDVNHPSFRTCAVSPLGHKTDFGQQQLAQALALAAPRKRATAGDAAGRRQYAGLTCWRDTPELFRRVIVRLADLPAEVASKFDKDLTETEKAMLRAAIRDVRQVTAALAAL